MADAIHKRFDRTNSLTCGQPAAYAELTDDNASVTCTACIAELRKMETIKITTTEVHEDGSETKTEGVACVIGSKKDLDALFAAAEAKPKAKGKPLSAKVAAAVASLEKDHEQGLKGITPAVYSWAFGRAASASAFRIAKARGLIVEQYRSAAGTPVYQSAKAAQ